MEALEKAVGKIQKHQEHTQLRKENEAYQKNRFLQAMLQKGVTEEQLEELLQKLWIFLHPSGTVSMYSDLGAGFRNG